jgi:hypothetical protein
MISAYRPFARCFIAGIVNGLFQDSRPQWTPLCDIPIQPSDFEYREYRVLAR